MKVPMNKDTMRIAVKTTLVMKEISEIMQKVERGEEVSTKDLKKFLDRLNIPKREEIVKAIEEYKRTKDEEKLFETLSSIIGIDAKELLEMAEFFASILAL